MSFIHTLTDPAIPPAERQKALDRAFADPGIPDAKRTTSSFWLQNPDPELAKICSISLPHDADIVIIGSGITAASVAKVILECGEWNRNENASISPPRVLILEARDLCSGATGRNGGHVLETAEEFTGLEERFGLEVAKKLTRFKMAHLKEVIGVAETYGLVEEAQVRKVEFLSASFDETKWEEVRRSIGRLKECMPGETKEWKIIEKDEIPKEHCLPHACGIITGPGGALWPYKFITGIFNRLRKDFPSNLLIETNTPVTGIQEVSDAIHPYTLTTPRGTIHTRHIIHCTNAHAGGLIPGLRGRICPVRGQMSAQTPGIEFPMQGRKHSWVFNFETGFDYLTQLPHGPHSRGEMMLGGGSAQDTMSGLADFGIATDSELSLKIDIHLSGALRAVLGRDNWGEVVGPAVKMMWTGNMGFSADGLPWVGRLPYSLTGRGTKTDGQTAAEWICAGFNGEGMVNAWLCGKALGLMLLQSDRRLPSGISGDLSWFPEEMTVSEKRVRNSVLPRHAEPQKKNDSSVQTLAQL